MGERIIGLDVGGGAVHGIARACLFLGAAHICVPRFSTKVASPVRPSPCFFCRGRFFDAIDDFVAEINRGTGGGVLVLPLSGGEVHGGEAAGGEAGVSASGWGAGGELSHVGFGSLFLLVSCFDFVVQYEELFFVFRHGC